MSQSGKWTGGEWLNDLFEQELSRRGAEHQLRKRIPLTTIDSVHVEIDGRRYVNFASNDYLGLSHHPAVIRAVQEALAKYGAGSGASALVSGFTEAHRSAEEAIARWKGSEAAVLLPSGYQAAHAIVQTIAATDELHQGGVRFLLDKLCHASLVDAVRGSGRVFRVFPHNNLEKLERLLGDALEGQLQIVVTESIFSMDGEAADLEGIGKLKQRYPFLLVLDEAHGSGVYGRDGAGYAAEKGFADLADVSLVTLSKAAGVAGGAVCGTRIFCDGVVNWGRAYVYSTAIPAAVASAIEAAIGVMKAEPQRQERVRELARRVREELKSGGQKISEGDSPIIPVILGSEKRAMEAANSLREKQILAIAIRPPTVARETSRLRITLSCDHSDEEIDRLIKALRGI
ncbi:MAG TPA: 8-amino-7-oxononanoate synthase [Tepidisphaeraceae bacterium]|jgi:8-amino-7-oxononanoate synthase|nr:8-amino-7-oxononanoate synthase [Tepidisphaeraceae bacterium]